MGPIVVHFCGPYLESYKEIPKRNYYGAYGQCLRPKVLGAQVRDRWMPRCAVVHWHMNHRDFEALRGVRGRGGG